MKTKNIFRTLLMAVGLLMGTMSAQAVETEIWNGSISATSETNITASSSWFENTNSNTKIRVYATIDNASNWKLYIGQGYYGLPDLQGVPSDGNVTQNTTNNGYNGTYFEYQFKDGTRNNFYYNNGLGIAFYGLTITSVTLVTDSEISGPDTPQSKPTHKVYWRLNYNEIYQTDEVEEDQPIPSGPSVVREGYSFGGWGSHPAVMPNYDIYVEGTLTKTGYVITYVIDNQPYSSVTLAVGATIVPPTPEAREHYTFAWGYYPETMPERDLTVNGSYTALPTYTVTWILNNNNSDVVRTDNVYVGDPLPTPPTVNRHGYAFEGWGEIPSVMPGWNITINGTITQNLFTIIFVVDNREVDRTELEKGSYVTLPTVTVPEGKKVQWDWYSTIVQGDATIKGKIVDIPKHTLTYWLDNSVYRSYEVYEDAALTPEADPERDGYTFTGWYEIPQYMPTYDLNIYGYYSQNYMPQSPTWQESTVTYAVHAGDTFSSGQEISIQGEQGNIVATLTYGESGGADFVAAVANSAISEFEAYTEGNGTNGNESGGTFYTITPNFDGFIAIGVVLNKGKAFYILENGQPLDGYEGMVNNVKVKKAYGFSVTAGKTYKIYASGSKLGFYGFKFDYSTPKYTMTYTVDGRTYHIDRLEEGVVPPLPSDPTKTGYRFTGWTGVPAYMPAEDQTAEAQFEINYYKLTYMVDGQVLETIDYVYGADITPRSYPSQYGYTFSGWNNLPTKMPAYDVTVEGRFLKEIQYIQATISSSTGYATFSYSEPLDFTNVTGLQAYIVKQVNETTAELEQVTGVIAAGTGLIIKGSTSTIPTSNTSLGVSPSGNLLVGVTGSSQTIKSANAFVLTEVNGVARFQATEGHEAVIPENHAYLSTPSSSRTLRIVLADKTTDIDDMPVAEKAPLVIYDLRGHRVPNPKKGTLYIVNGKQTVWK